MKQSFLVALKTKLRPLKPAVQGTARLVQSRRLHILFLVHDYSYLRNFDDCIRSLVRKGHTLTLAFPQRKEGKPQAVLERFSAKGINVIMVPRARDDEWATLAGFIRKARSYLLYRRSDFSGTQYLQERVAEATPEDVKAFLARPFIRSHPRLTDFACRLIEAAIPAPAVARKDLSALKPDVVLITPFFTFSTRYQVEYAKAAREFSVPVAVPVFSWDNLTSKGAFQIRPDRLFVWNQTQVREAATLHNISASRVVVTGGMRFSKFFGARPGTTKERFCEKVGLDPSNDLITYLGSSRTIAPREHEFLWRWISALRAAEDPRVRSCNIYVRPHPGNPAIWDNWPARSELGVSLWDGQGSNVEGVIESVGHSAAVFGINTTAMLEAAALDKPVLTVLDKDLVVGQTERIHFHYLTSVAGGLVTVAKDFSEHINHLAAILAGDPLFARKSRRFSKAFLRPPFPYRSPIAAFESATLRLGRRRPRTRLSRFLMLLLRPAIARLADTANKKAKQRRQKSSTPSDGVVSSGVIEAKMDMAERASTAGTLSSIAE